MSDLITCAHCKTKMRSAAKPGTKVRCPKCKEIFAIPDEDEDIVEAEERPERGIRKGAPPPAKPSKRGARDDEDEEDEEDDEDERPRRSSKKAAPPPRSRPKRLRDDDEDEEDEEDDEAPRRRGTTRRGRGSNYRREDAEVHIGDWFRYAGAHYTAVAAGMIAFGLVSAAIYVIAMSLIGYLIIEVDAKVGVLVEFIVLLGLLPLQLGYHIVALKQLQRQRWEFADFFGGYRYFGPVLTHFLFMVLATIGMIFPSIFFLLFTDDIAIVIPAGALMAFGVLFIFVMMYYFSQQLIIDRRCGGLSALSDSWKLTEGNRIRLFFGFIMLMIFLMIPAYVTSFVLSLVAPFSLDVLKSYAKFISWVLIHLLTPMAVTTLTMPFVVLAWNTAYLQMAGSNPPAPLDDEYDDEEDEEDDRPRRRRR